MQVLQAYKPFEVQEIELKEWQQRPVKNNFFELVLIKEGKGTQCINYNLYDYKNGSLFLLPPLKCHSFQIEEQTRFVFLKFTSDFFSAHGQAAANHQDWFKEAAYILSNYNQLPGDIISSESPTYLSEFFRKKVKMSLREYIIKAKLKLVEIRLLNSDYTLTEIAAELSFTDVSHLSKTFKRYTGMSIREFKKQGEYQLLKRSVC